MKILRTVIIVCLIISAGLYTGAYMFFSAKAKDMIIDNLKNTTRKNVSIGSFRLDSAFNIELKELSIEGLLRAETLDISPDILASLFGTVVLKSMEFTKSEFTVEKNFPSIEEIPLPAGSLAASSNTAVSKSGAAGKPAAAGKETGQIKIPPLVIKRLTIKNGRLDYFDKTQNTNGVKIIVQDIDFNARNLVLSNRSAVTTFDFKGNIPWREGKDRGTIEAQGWINLFKNDMGATLKISGIDGIQLYPYYAKWVNVDPSRIESAKLDFTSEIKGVNNDITADCHLELTELGFKKHSSQEKEDKTEKIANAILGALRALDQGRIEVNFKIKTKLKKPVFGFNDIKSAVEEKIAYVMSRDLFGGQNIALLPVKIVGGTVKETVILTKAVIGGTFSAGQEFKKALFAAFKKEKDYD